MDWLQFRTAPEVHTIFMRLVAPNPTPDAVQRQLSAHNIEHSTLVAGTIFASVPAYPEQVDGYTFDAKWCAEIRYRDGGVSVDVRREIIAP